MIDVYTTELFFVIIKFSIMRNSMNTVVFLFLLCDLTILLYTESTFDSIFGVLPINLKRISRSLMLVVSVLLQKKIPSTYKLLPFKPFFEMKELRTIHLFKLKNTAMCFVLILQSSRHYHITQYCL